jgi:hypothetical protein
MATDIGRVTEIIRKEPTIKDLTKVLTPLEHQYQILGTQLELEDHIITGIHRTYDSNSTKLKNILNEWITKRSSPVTWKTIIDVVENNPIKNIRVRNQIIEYLNRVEIFHTYSMTNDFN